jgi:uncharacterized protein (TIGR00266 family)
VEHRIVGTVMPVLEMMLQPGEVIVSEAGELSWMGASIEMQTHTQAAGGGGVFGAIKRVAGGGTLFMTEYRAHGGAGLLAFAAKIPGHILQIDVQPNQVYLMHRHGFLCATQGIELSTGFQQSLGAGVFGGDGFRLQKVTGRCTTWVELSGEVIIKDLQPGEVLRVHPGHVGMFDGSVNFSITRIKGIKNMIFGGDGIFLAEMTGPGRVWLQSMPLSNLAHALGPYLVGGEAKAGAAGGILGAVIKGASG